MWMAERAKELLNKEGRTRKWLASQCGIDVNSLKSILAGRKPSRPVIKLMAQALNCSESDLDTDLAHEGEAKVG